VTAGEIPHVRYRRALGRGAFINMLGTLGRGGLVLNLLVVTWLWGAAFTGLYLLAQAMWEVAVAAVVDAPGDAAVVFASRHAEDAIDGLDVRARRYRALATALRAALLLAAGVVLFALVAARPLIARFLPDYRDLVPGIYLVALALIPRTLGQGAIAATKSMLRMEHDALLNGLVHPALLVGGGALVHALGGGITALLAAQLVVETVVCLLALHALGRYFSLRELGAAVCSGPPDSAVLHFVLPQALNLTFNKYIGRLDSLLLAGFGVGKVQLAYYSTAALLANNIPQIRSVFSGALAPVVARLHATGERAAFDETLSTVARWTTSIVVPVVLALTVFREDVLRLASHDYGRESLFILVLLIPSFTNCAYGLAGACLMYTGHTRVTLANSVTTALLGTGLMCVLIPRFGMIGAATATAIGTSLMTGLQMIELHHLERVAIRWRQVWRPHLGLALGLIPIVLAWDPARLAAPMKVAVALAACGVAALLLVFPRRRRSSSRS
jgi:O-antigen/teichoic acid export membrane protein